MAGIISKSGRRGKRDLALPCDNAHETRSHALGQCRKISFEVYSCCPRNMRGATRRRRVSACSQAAYCLCQLSKNDSSPSSEKKPFYIIPAPEALQRLLSVIKMTVVLKLDRPIFNLISIVDKPVPNGISPSLIQ